MEENKEQEQPKIELPLKHERFVQIYLSKEFFANGVLAYGEAYDIDVTNPKQYNVAKVNACRLLTDANVLARINQLLDSSGFNDAFVDKQTLFVITQNADMHAKMKAIDTYNKLKARITDKLEVKGDIEVTIKLE